MKKLLALLILLVSLPTIAAEHDVIGEVKTATNFLGPNDTIGVAVFQDPKVPGAYCYIASAQKGGFSANFGMQEDTSEYQLSCFTDTAIKLPVNLPQNEVIDEVNRSLVFKKMYVARFVDTVHHRLVYVAYTRYLIDGSPKHAMSSLSYTP